MQKVITYSQANAFSALFITIFGDLNLELVKYQKLSKFGRFIINYFTLIIFDIVNYQF